MRCSAPIVHTGDVTPPGKASIRSRYQENAANVSLATQGDGRLAGHKLTCQTIAAFNATAWEDVTLFPSERPHFLMLGVNVSPLFTASTVSPKPLQTNRGLLRPVQR